MTLAAGHVFWGCQCLRQEAVQLAAEAVSLGRSGYQNGADYDEEGAFCYRQSSALQCLEGVN